MIKAYYIIRRDLKMPEEKLAVQVGHGTDFIHLNHSQTKDYQNWVNNDRRKIVLRTNTELSLQNIINLCEEKSIPFYRIEDNGNTFFTEKTLTGIVVYPIEENYLPKKIKKLQAWRG